MRLNQKKTRKPKSYKEACFIADEIEKCIHQTPEPQDSWGRWDRKRIHEVCGRERIGRYYGTTVQLGMEASVRTEWMKGRDCCKVIL